MSFKPAVVIDNGTGCVCSGLGWLGAVRRGSCATQIDRERHRRGWPFVSGMGMASDAFALPSRSYTKMGYAGNNVPNYIVPSFIATHAEEKGKKKSDVHDLDFFIGEEAAVKRPNYNLDYPVRHGIVENWDNMEKYWQRCIYQYLRCDPEEHYFLLVGARTVAHALRVAHALARAVTHRPSPR
jgi:hypothetical protein